MYSIFKQSLKHEPIEYNLIFVYSTDVICKMFDCQIDAPYT